MAAAVALAPARYAGFWRRLAAYLIDLVLLSIVLRLLPGPDIVKNVVLPVVYFVALWTLLGATLGMRAMGVRLLDRNGKKPNLVQAAVRALGYVVSAIPFGLGFLWIAFDARKQGWHDKIAGTFAGRGVFVPVATPATPVQVAGASAAPRAGGRVPTLVVVLLVILVVFTGTTAAAGYYILAPDIKPRAIANAIPNVDDAKAMYFPALAGATGPVILPSPNEVKVRDQVVADVIAASGPPPAVRQADQQMMQQLRATGLPVTMVMRTPLSSGKMAMVVAMDYGKIAAGSTDGGFGESVKSVVQLAKSNQLNVTQVDHVIVGIQDSQGRVLFSAASASSSIMQLRSGQIDQRKFIAGIAIQPVSRVAMIDAIRGQVDPRDRR